MLTHEQVLVARRLWGFGHDTVDIATHPGLTEADIYRDLWCIRRKAPPRKSAAA